MKWHLHIQYKGQDVANLDIKDATPLTLGRSESSTVILSENHRISRTHLTITLQPDGSLKVVNLGKYVPALFNGSNFNELNVQNTSSLEMDGYTISLIGTAEKSSNTSSALVQYQAMDDESSITAVGAVTLKPSLIIHDPRFPHSPEELILEGDFWVAGRDSQCAIKLEDPKISRQQFQLKALKGNKFAVIDMGSVNGTLINGVKIPSGEEILLNSGDMIQTHEFKILFQLKNMDVEKRLQEINSLPALSSDLALSLEPFHQQNELEQHYYPPNDDHYDSEPSYDIPQVDDALEKTKKIRMILIGAIALIAVVYMFSSGSKEVQKKDVVIETPFDKLTPEDKLYVEQTYALADNYFRQAKFASALDEIRKIQEKVEYYKDSKQIADACKEGLVRVEELAAAERRKQEEIAIKNKVEAVISTCTKLISDDVSEAQMQECLSEGLTLDPENLAMRELLAEARSREDQRATNQAAFAERRRLAKIGEGLFYKAEGLKNKGKKREAIKAYQTHINSRYPDPSGLKDKSMGRIAELRTFIDQEIATAQKDADQLVEQGNLKAALKRIRRALAFEPNSTALIATDQKLTRELDKKMRVLYQESVIEESLGNIEAAKERWNIILKTDIETGEYFKKASLKNRKYGG